MPKFMVIIHSAPGFWQNLSPEEMQRKVEKYQAWVGKLKSSGRHVGGEKLREEGGKALRLEKGRVQAVDGPYSEAKEVLGGYFLIEAANYDQAVERTKDHPHLHYGGTIEVRAIHPMHEQQQQ